MAENEEKFPIPELVQEGKIPCTPVLLRTILKREVYDELKDFAQEYSTARGYWDFGVAIQLLLEEHKGSRQVAMSNKLDLILNVLSGEKQVSQEEEKKIEMLGGSTIPAR